MRVRRVVAAKLRDVDDDARCPAAPMILKQQLTLPGEGRRRGRKRRLADDSLADSTQQRRQRSILGNCSATRLVARPTAANSNGRMVSASRRAFGLAARTYQPHQL